MKWHHSLYWRIAVGFVACLALLLVVQGMLFVWVVARGGNRVPNQPPERLAQAIAVDIAQGLQQDAALNVEAYLRQEYGADAPPFFAVIAGRPDIEVGGPFPDGMVDDARARLAAMQRNPMGPGPTRGRGFAPGPQGSEPPGPGGRMPGPPPFDRFEPGERGGRPRNGRPGPIVVNGQLEGLVVVPPQPPFTFLLARYAPTLAGVALTTLVVGALVATLLIFGPARQRLRAVEEAARRLGAGDLAARAPSSGRDEVAAVAAAFNSMAADLSARADALAASDRARRQLLADVSHELNTPVTAMRGYLETLSMPEMALDETTRARYLAIIADETGRLERIIGDLLELARLEGGGGSVRLAPVPIEELFGRVRARHERALGAAGVTMRTVIEPGLSSVQGDRDRLEQALQNLAANALRYAPAGSAIELGGHRRRGGVVLSVTDEGSGIAPEHLPHLFDRFYKADAARAARQEAGGSGLGLSIVKAIAERHGGSVSVTSEPGRTVFEIQLKTQN